MIYDKPDVILLGPVSKVVEATGMKPYQNLLDGARGENPAYDLDE
jgi:hypothetical protein